mgnify:CR=1 FL=1
MYIWILLATFMIALSFLNLSPRQDKQSVFSEIKAASHINRFRAEHVAATRTMECELLYNGSRYSSEYLISPDLNVGYTSVSNNLPLGYDTTVNIGEVFHYAYCFKKPISDEAELSTNCGSSEDRYVISFVQLPARWISKEETKIKIGDVEDSVITPLPDSVIRTVSHPKLLSSPVFTAVFLLETVAVAFAVSFAFTSGVLVAGVSGFVSVFSVGSAFGCSGSLLSVAGITTWIRSM